LNPGPRIEKQTLVEGDVIGERNLSCKNLGYVFQTLPNREKVNAASEKVKEGKLKHDANNKFFPRRPAFSLQRGATKA